MEIFAHIKSVSGAFNWHIEVTSAIILHGCSRASVGMCGVVLCFGEVGDM